MERRKDGARGNIFKWLPRTHTISPHSRPLSLLSFRGLGTLGLRNRPDSPATQSHAAGAASAGGAGSGGVFGGAGGVPVQPHGSVRDNVHHFEIDEEAGAHGPSSSFFGQRVEETGWLEHLRLVLSSSVLVAEKLYLEVP